MRKVIASSMTAVLVFIPNTGAFAASTVPYKSQRAGQFCKSVDVGKSVKLPDGTKLKCLKDGARARWKR